MKKILLTLLVLLVAAISLASSNKYSDPSQFTVVVTPSDATEYSPPLKAVYVGTTGDVRAIATGDAGTYDCTDAPVFVAHPAGQYLKVRVWKLCATGTAASDLVGLPLNRISIP